MSTTKTDAITAATLNTDLEISGNGTGVPNLATGAMLNGVAFGAGATSAAGLTGFRNRIINGDMRVSQRAASYVAPSNSDVTLDRWSWGNSTSGVVTITQDSSDTPDDATAFALKVDTTTALGSVAAGDLAYVFQRIEADNISDFALGTATAKTITVSFDVKSTKTGTFCISLNNSAADRTYRVEYTVDVTDTWESKSVTIALDTTGTWVTSGNGKGMTVYWTLVTGSTYQGTNDTWEAGTVTAGTANQVNALDNLANNFLLANVQVEIGTAKTDFEQRPLGYELALCQRYYHHTYQPGEYPGDNVGFQGTLNFTGFSSTSAASSHTFPVTMRATPTAVPYSTTGTANDGTVRNTGSN
ncbi:hypothetical protein N9937_02140, partial [bacterium]|nr:hypothetical protein [bacterium]